MKATCGRWDRSAWPTYFLAQNISTLVYTDIYAADHLIAVNEIRNDDDIACVERVIDRVNVLVDSGVYNLAMEHAKSHGMSMDQALGLTPEEVDGFDALFSRYVELAKRWGDRCWGLIEIDYGGCENKKRTRARLEALGLRPMPVFHPLNDGWDYFDELAQNYDRMCFGNVVQADIGTRKRLVATAWERRRKYPDLWIHLLGLTPSAMTVAFPCNSCDSSTWMGAVRWGQMAGWTATQRLWSVGPGWIYDRDADSAGARGHNKSAQVMAYDAGLMGRCMRRIVEDQRRELGCDPTGAL